MVLLLANRNLKCMSFYIKICRGGRSDRGHTGGKPVVHFECITIRSQNCGRCHEVTTPTILYSICHAQKGSREDTGHNDAAGAPKSSLPGTAAMSKLVLIVASTSTDLSMTLVC